VWFDYDNDGRLDLFVCRFVDFDKSKNKFCGNEKTGERFYCIPAYLPAGKRAGSSTTTGTVPSPTSARNSGIAKALGKAWGVVATDVNNDGWMDLFVANDTVANFLFVNKRNGKFDEMGLESGRGLQASLAASAPAWEVDSADFDQERLARSLRYQRGPGNCTPSTATITTSRSTIGPVPWDSGG